MKKLLLWLVFFGLLTGVIIGVTETHNEGSGSGRQRNSAFKAVTISDSTSPFVDFTETINSIYGFVYRIVIDSTGTDTDFDVIVKDENTVTIFTHTTLTSVSEPYGFAIYEDDTEGNPWAGVPIAGAMTVELANGDDDALTAITIKISYIEFWK